jgi:putative spermidine/putrescine transport system substrate-binding protein
MRLRLVWSLLLCCALFGCSNSTYESDDKILLMPWDEITKTARQKTVKMAMWDGDPLINAYMRDYVAVRLREQCGVELQLVGGQGNDFVNKLTVDLEAGRARGDFDVMWINGETFYQLRKLNALFGPYTDKLPNSELIDWNNRFIAIDFQQPVAGMECPWGNVQLALIYHPARVSQPPKSLDALTLWIKSHPGRFTFDNSFTGMTFLKSLLYALADGEDALSGPFDEVVYKRETEKLWSYLLELKPYLWREGATFPEGVAQLHQLFMNGEVDFTMSNNDGEVDNKAAQGIIPDESRAFVLDSGTIRNSHYLGIPLNAPNKEAALVLINFLISPEAQLKKALPEVWGDGTVLDITKLSDEYRTQFSQLPGRVRVAPREELEQRALMEPAPEWMIRLHEDFRQRIIEARP